MKSAMKPSKLPMLQVLRLSHYVYGDSRTAYLVVRDPRAGRKNVYTVFRIAIGGWWAVRTIGRELSLPIARRIVRQDMAGR